MQKIITFVTAIFVFAAAQSSAQAETVLHVMLQEWRIVTDKTEIPAGPVKISIQNRGQETHEIVLLQSDLKYDKLPMDTSKGGINEDRAGVVIDEVEDLSSKTRKEMFVNLKPGNYILLCNMVEIEDGEKEQHYSMGMRAPIVVR